MKSSRPKAKEEAVPEHSPSKEAPTKAKKKRTESAYDSQKKSEYQSEQKAEPPRVEYKTPTLNRDHIKMKKVGICIEENQITLTAAQLPKPPKNIKKQHSETNKLCHRPILPEVPPHLQKKPQMEKVQVVDREWHFNTGDQPMFSSFKYRDGGHQQVLMDPSTPLNPASSAHLQPTNSSGFHLARMSNSPTRFPVSPVDRLLGKCPPINSTPGRGQNLRMSFSNSSVDKLPMQKLFSKKKELHKSSSNSTSLIDP